MKIVFLDFDGVLNNDKFFHLRLDELTKERDHKWSLLKFFDINKIKPEQIHRVEIVKYFYTEMSYENIKNFIRIFKNIRPNQFLKRFMIYFIRCLLIVNHMKIGREFINIKYRVMIVER